jgi:hypothetical protein
VQEPAVTEENLLAALEYHFSRIVQAHTEMLRQAERQTEMQFQMVQALDRLSNAIQDNTKMSRCIWQDKDTSNG